MTLNKELLREAGKMHQSIMAGAIGLIQMKFQDRKPISTWDINDFIDRLIDESDECSAPFKKVDDYGFASCICINHEIVHARPNKKTLLKMGDLVDVDFGLRLEEDGDSVIVDAARTIVAGSNAVKERHPLIEYCEEWRNIMISRCLVGAKVMKLAADLDQMIPNPHRYGIVLGYPGHGVGQTVLHVPPVVPSTPVSRIPTFWWEHQAIRENYRLREGDVIAIEPIAVERMPEKWKNAVIKDKDGWREVLANKSFCAHTEHTVLITNEGPEIIA